MFSYLAEKTACFLIRRSLLDIEGREIYTYSLEILLLNISLLAIFLLISLVTESFIHYIGFILFFVPIRIFAGGYHSRKSENCFMISFFVYILTTIIFTLYRGLYKEPFLMALGLLSAVIILLFAPIVNHNHPLNTQQRKRNRYIVLGIILAYFAVFIFLYKVNFTLASNELIFIITASLSMIAEKARGILYKIIGKITSEI